eukprot:COSAG06_NODE_706_length_12904_cov_11.211636_10_plen_155_part_00
MSLQVARRPSEREVSASSSSVASSLPVSRSSVASSSPLMCWEIFSQSGRDNGALGDGQSHLRGCSLEVGISRVVAGDAGHVRPRGGRTVGRLRRCDDSEFKRSIRGKCSAPAAAGAGDFKLVRRPKTIGHQLHAGCRMSAASFLVMAVQVQAAS